MVCDAVSVPSVLFDDEPPDVATAQMSTMTTPDIWTVKNTRVEALMDRAQTWCSALAAIYPV